MTLRNEELENLKWALAGIQRRDLQIYLRYYQAEPKTTYRKLGREFGCSGERVRQIIERISSELTHTVKPVAQKLAEQLTPQMNLIESKETVDSIFEEAVPECNEEIRPILFQQTVDELEHDLQNDFYVHEKILEKMESARWIARDYVDDASIIDQKEFRKEIDLELDDDQWNKFLDLSGIYRHSNSISLKKTDKAMAKAVLLELERPASISEIADRLGWPEKKTGGALANLKSVGRDSRKEWAVGLEESKKYAGIEQTMMEYIESHGGSVPRANLVKDVSQALNCKEGSIVVYLKTLRFISEGDFVQIRPLDLIDFKPLDEVIHGRTTDHEPYFDFELRDRHLKGYSFIGVPYEFVLKLGCELNGACKVKVVNLPRTVPLLSAQAMLGSTTKATIGRVRRALEFLGAKEGDTVRVTITAPYEVRMQKTDSNNNPTSLREHQSRRSDSYPIYR